MFVFIITALIILLVSLPKDGTCSANLVSSIRNDNDNEGLSEILKRIDRMLSNINIRIEKLEANVQNIEANVLNLVANDLNMQNNIKNQSIVMETIVEQQMVITAEIFTVSQTLPFCCCQYQNTTEPPKIETTTLKIETTTPKPVKSFPTNCAEAMEESDPDGVYRIYVKDSNIGPFNVYCMKKVMKSFEEEIINGTWLIIQRRQDGTTDFHRNWNTYKQGFGDLKVNFWIGLDKLYTLTKSTEQELWVQLEDRDGITAWAKYSQFAIGNESEKYKLKTLGSYNGTAGDSLTYSKDQKWSTFDRDNDLWPSFNCADKYGAWWHDNCAYGRLNGRYEGDKDDKGIHWRSFREGDFSLRYSHMAIRPRK